MRIIRSKETLDKGLSEIDEAIANIKTNPPSAGPMAYDTYKLEAMMVIAKAAIISALSRCESRGAHKRLDYPDSSEAFETCSKASYKNGEIEVTFFNENSKEEAR